MLPAFFTEMVGTSFEWWDEQVPCSLFVASTAADVGAVASSLAIFISMSWFRASSSILAARGTSEIDFLPAGFMASYNVRSNEVPITANCCQPLCKRLLRNDGDLSHWNTCKRLPAIVLQFKHAKNKTTGKNLFWCPKLPIFFF